MKKEIDVKIRQDTVDSEGDISYDVHINNLNDYFTINKDGEVVIRLTILFCELLNIHTHDDYMNLLKEYDIKHPINHYPKDNTLVYVILTDGTIDERRWDNNTYIREVYTSNNVFHTREEAEQHIKREKAIRKVTDRIKELNDGWYPDWDDGKVKYYFNSYNHSTNSMFVDYYFHKQSYPNNYYMKSYKVANQIKDEMFDDIKLMLGVE